MSNVLNLKGVKLFAIVVLAVALLATFGVVAVQKASADCSITTTLRVGSRGAEVMCLQTKVGASADGVFGPMTNAAVKAFQASHGLVADGIVGPLTRAALMGAATGNFPAGCTSAAGYSPTTGVKCDSGPSSGLPAGCSSTAGYSPLTGVKCDSTGPSAPSGPLTGEGTIEDVETLSQLSSEEVAEGNEGVEVAGADIEVSNDGDIELRSVKVSFDPTGNAAGDSDNLDDYLEAVSIWLDGDEVGSADVNDFTENSDDTWSKTISVSNAVIGADDTAELVIAVDAVGSHDSGDIDSDSWTVVVESIRYEDGDGVVTTDSTTGDLGDTGTSIGSNGTAGDGVPIAFVSFATAADTEVKLSTHPDNPDAQIVVVSDTGTTDNVVLLKGEIEVEGDSDVTMDEFLVSLSPGTSTFQSMVSGITLEVGDEEFSESVPTIAAGASATLTFDDMDYVLEGGDTVEFTLLAEIADIDDFTAGSTIVASVTATNRDNFDLENEQGDQLAAGERSGTVGGEAQTFRENGVLVELVDADAVKSAVDANDGDTGTFTIEFKVTALGDNVYVASVASPDGAMANSYALDYSGTATTTDQSAAFTNDTDADLSTGGVYLIEEGETETFTMTVVRNASATDGLYRVSLTGVRWDTDDDSTPDNLYTTELDAFKTPYIALD